MGEDTAQGMCQSVKDTCQSQLSSIEVKQLRDELQVIIDKLENSGYIRFKENAVHDLMVGKMWLGQCLGKLPEGGEDLNAKRDAQEVQEARQEQVKDTPV